MNCRAVIGRSSVRLHGFISFPSVSELSPKSKSSFRNTKCVRKCSGSLRENIDLFRVFFSTTVTHFYTWPLSDAFVTSSRNATNFIHLQNLIKLGNLSKYIAERWSEEHTRRSDSVTFVPSFQLYFLLLQFLIVLQSLRTSEMPWCRVYSLASLPEWTNMWNSNRL